MLELFTVGIKEAGGLSIEMNEGLLQVANEEELSNTISDIDIKVIYNLAMKISKCVVGEE